MSVSATTRAPREGELDGIEYRFVDDQAFDAMVLRGELAEWAVVHGYRYGTPREPIDSAIAAGHDVLLDIDVQGARQVADRYPGAVTVFLLPPDYASLEARLRGRRSDSEEAIARRLRTAVTEVRHYGAFQYLVVNDALERAAGEIRSILQAERARTARRIGAAERILATFPPASP